MNQKYATRPLWFWNELPTKETITEIMENCSQKDGYAGFGILPYRACRLEYMGEEYLELYGFVLKEAKRLDLKICLYDEWWFPSGSAGGILKRKYPEACAKRLDMEEYLSDSTHFEIVLPENGRLMALVAMKNEMRIDVMDDVKDGALVWDAPAEGYRVLCFILRDAGLNRVDYLDPAAVKKFIACTHDVYYGRFSEYFGNVIDSAFYDEPQFYSAKGRAWTASFNEKFFEKYGESPAIYYPALYYDIGKDTAKARDRMFSLRAELYANGFPKIIQEWCSEHGISLTGHVDQEEAENPCGITGDLMKSFQYQDIPGIDEIFFEGRASEAYKIVSSAALNWNKQKVMCECFGAIEDITENAIYRETYDLFTKGVNVLVPHAVWQDTDEDKVKFKPELSYRHPYYGKILPQYNEYCALIQSKLQRGGQVNTAAVLYPIESQRYIYRFSWDGDPVSGGPTWENNNYMKLGQYLSRSLNCDYAFLHPDVLAEHCRTEDGVISIENSMHYQNYRIMILPGMKAMALRTARKLREFVYGGGVLVSVSELPSMATDFAENEELDAIIKDLFGTERAFDRVYQNERGKGRCYFLPYSERAYLAEILQTVRLDTKISPRVEGLQYIRKRHEDHDIWYFAALSDPVDTEITVNGNYLLTATDPKNGNKREIICRYDGDCTKFRLALNREESVVIEGTCV